MLIKLQWRAHVFLVLPRSKVRTSHVVRTFIEQSNEDFEERILQARLPFQAFLGEKQDITTEVFFADKSEVVLVVTQFSIRKGL